MFSFSAGSSAVISVVTASPVSSLRSTFRGTNIELSAAGSESFSCSESDFSCSEQLASISISSTSISLRESRVDSTGLQSDSI